MSGPKPVTAKTVYNRSTDGWEVIRDGGKVEGRAAILALPAGARVTLTRKGETEEVIIAGEDSQGAASDATSVVLDTLATLRKEDRHVLETYVRGQTALASSYERLAAVAMGVAERAAALNTGLAVSLATAYGDNGILRAQLARNPGESDEHWLERLIRHAPQLVAMGRMMLAPLPPASDAAPGDSALTKEG